MVGTPKNSVGPEVEKLRSRRLVLEALQQPHAAPADAASSAARCPARGRETTAAPAGSGRRAEICQHVMRLSALAAKLLCVRIAPLDAPVVPEV